MRAADLDLRDLLELEPKGGILRFAGERILLLDAAALGILRHQLIEAFGLEIARGLLVRFGFAHGWRVAEVVKKAIPWDNEEEWRRAGGRLHRLKGLVTFEPVAPGAASADAPFAEAIWPDSYEADEHLAHRGRSNAPACFTLIGFASGYLSKAFGAEVRCLETRCRARGDAVCRMEGRLATDWGEDVDLSMYEPKALDATLERLRDRLEARTPYAIIPATSPLDPGPDETHGIVARSAEMRRILALARKVARVDTSVLITGESGTGKERLARFVHEESARQGGPFVAVNCGALPESLLESELFGHAKGAFTGADRDREGLFEAARGGTLFLDEIGEVPVGMQVKLLRALQEREVRRIGETRDRPVDVRIVAATNRDLLFEVERERFREDLYYRLGVVELRLPPLRERLDDVIPLARVLLERLRSRIARPEIRLGNEACQALLRHDWPGNVRELENALERALVMNEDGIIRAEDLGLAAVEPIREPAPIMSAPLTATLEEVERAHIRAVLDAHGGHRRNAARALGIGEATLYRKLKSWRP